MTEQLETEWRGEEGWVCRRRRVRLLTSTVCAASNLAAAALRWGNATLTMTLLAGGANPNAVEYGRTELDHAVLGGSIDCVNLLIASGAKLGVRSHSSGHSHTLSLPQSLTQ